MKVLLLSESDINGGAARAAYRLHQGLQSAGVGSTMLVRDRFSSDPTVIPRKTLLTKLGPASTGQILRLYPQGRDAHFAAQWLPDDLLGAIAKQDADLINLHWICNGFMQIETAGKLNKPVVWTLQDMWGLTGGCHYAGDCDRYMQSCGACPQLKSQREQDLSRWVWQRKMKSWRKMPLNVVVASQWMADCTRASSVFQDARVEVIPMGLDPQVYRPIPKAIARELLNLPLDRQLVMFGAMNATGDKRKGFPLLLAALQNLDQAGWSDRVELVIFGASKPKQPLELGFKTHYLNQLKDDLTLAIAYSAADVMVVPSLQEAFGQTASEAFACGTPVVAFNATGLKDIVDHQQNGYLATPYKVDDLARGIAWVLEDRDRQIKLAQSAREKVLCNFTIEQVTAKYTALFDTVLQKS